MAPVNFQPSLSKKQRNAIWSYAQDKKAISFSAVAAWARVVLGVNIDKEGAASIINACKAAQVKYISHVIKAKNYYQMVKKSYLPVRKSIKQIMDNSHLPKEGPLELTIENVKEEYYQPVSRSEPSLLETELSAWMREALSHGIHVSDQILTGQIIVLTSKLKLPSIDITENWIQQFRNRHSYGCENITGKIEKYNKEEKKIVQPILRERDMNNNTEHPNSREMNIKPKKEKTILKKKRINIKREQPILRERNLNIKREHTTRVEKKKLRKRKTTSEQF